MATPASFLHVTGQPDWIEWSQLALDCLFNRYLVALGGGRDDAFLDYGRLRRIARRDRSYQSIDKQHSAPLRR
ncbi:hypothetical protein D3C87_1687950 [compost metagenome]